MSEVLSRIWDGTNKATVTSGGALNTNIVGGSIAVEISAEINGASLNSTVTNWAATGSTEAKLGVTNAARLIADTLANRRILRISNQGATTLYISGTSAIVVGASALNFDTLAPAASLELENYSGPVYAAAGGASLAPVWTGVLQVS